MPLKGFTPTITTKKSWSLIKKVYYYNKIVATFLRSNATKIKG
jgi:hypothetical protein